VKPSNLWVEAPSGRVKVLDFGLTRGAKTGEPITVEGAVVGTPSYMAPEQGAGKSVDARADLFAVGCVLYRALAGSSPFQRESILATLTALALETPPSAATIAPALPPDLAGLIDRLMCKDPAGRPESAKAALAEVVRIDKELRGKPAAESLPVVYAPAAQVVSDPNPWTGIDDDAAAVASTGGLPPAAEPRPKPQSGPASGPSGKRLRTMAWVGGCLLGLAALITAGVIVIKIKDKNRTGTEIKAADRAAVEHFKDESVGAKKKPPTFQPDGFDQWVKKIAALPAEKQVEAVSRKLKEFNPEFDGKLSSPRDVSHPPVVEDGDVVELLIFTDKVADLSPIRALSKLRFLACRSERNTGQRLDLSPLTGMRIRALHCHVHQLDLSTVKGLSLSELVCYGGEITDLTPISGMPLRVLILAGNWGLKSLEPLKGMSLTTLTCDNTQVADLSPLRGMPLTTLVCHVTNVADLSPLKGMPLEMLSCERTPITDFSPLEGMKLKQLAFTPKPELKGLRVIRQMDSLLKIGTAYDKVIPSNEFWQEYDKGGFN
jgi:hypothetical protein